MIRAKRILFEAFGFSRWSVRLHRLNYCKGVYPVSFVDSLLSASFMMAIVFVALFALYLFVTLFSLIVETAEHAAKHKKTAK